MGDLTSELYALLGWESVVNLEDGFQCANTRWFDPHNLFWRIFAEA
jgi:hypothetical protein